MTKPRIGKSDSIFSPTVSSKPKTAETEPAYPSTDQKTTVILPPDLIMYLDRLGLDIRVKTGWKVRRTEIIRALIIALKESDLDLSSCKSEDDLADAVTRELRADSKSR